MADPRRSAAVPARARACCPARTRRCGVRWRTIRGQECSGYWPAGTAAFHIGADIADAVVRYQEATGDAVFEREIGLELLVETARFWRSLGHHDAQDSFRINGVTGPDEYSAIADNNVYTNLTAQRNLRAAAEAVRRHPRHAAALGADFQEAAAAARCRDHDRSLGRRARVPPPATPTPDAANPAPTTPPSLRRSDL